MRQFIESIYIGSTYDAKRENKVFFMERHTISNHHTFLTRGFLDDKQEEIWNCFKIGNSDCILILSYNWAYS